MPGAMPPRVTIMPNYAELCYYADYAAPMQLCRFIMLASSGMPNKDNGRWEDLDTSVATTIGMANGTSAKIYRRSAWRRERVRRPAGPYVYLGEYVHIFLLLLIKKCNGHISPAV